MKLPVGIGFAFVAATMIASLSMVTDARAAKTKRHTAAVQEKKPVAKPQVVEPTIPYAMLNGIAQSMYKSGVSTCLERVDQVTNFLVGKAPAGAVPFVSRELPNRRIISASMEIPGQQGPAYATATFAPLGTQNCGASYDAVIYWPDKCSDVAAKNFAKFPAIGAIKQDVAILDGGPNVRVFLMTAGQGCVSIKKEVLF